MYIQEEKSSNTKGSQRVGQGQSLCPLTVQYHNSGSWLSILEAAPLMAARLPFPKAPPLPLNIARLRTGLLAHEPPGKTQTASELQPPRGLASVRSLLLESQVTDLYEPLCKLKCLLSICPLRHPQQLSSCLHSQLLGGCDREIMSSRPA